MPLDKHYIPARYPDVFDERIPVDYYTRRDAEECLRRAGRILCGLKSLLEELKRALSRLRKCKIKLVILFESRVEMIIQKRVM